MHLVMNLTFYDEGHCHNLFPVVYYVGENQYSQAEINNSTVNFNCFSILINVFNIQNFMYGCLPVSGVNIP